MHTWLVLLVIAATAVALVPVARQTLRETAGGPRQAEAEAGADVPVSVA